MVIYLTINLINGKYYIGKDAKNDKNYLGSGKALKLALKKYGRNNFVKEIICNCLNLEDLNRKEILYITPEVINDRMSYNIAPGGTGGNFYVKRNNKYKGLTYEEMYGKTKSDLIKKKQSNGNSGEKNGMYGKHATAGERNGMYGKTGVLCPNYGIVKSPEVREKMAKVQRGKKASIETKTKMRESAKSRKLKYCIHQVDNNGNKMNEFRTIKEAFTELKLSPKKTVANKYPDFKFIKIYKNGVV